MMLDKKSGKVPLSRKVTITRFYCTLLFDFGVILRVESGKMSNFSFQNLTVLRILDPIKLKMYQNKPLPIGFFLVQSM